MRVILYACHNVCVEHCVLVMLCAWNILHVEHCVLVIRTYCSCVLVHAFACVCVTHPFVCCSASIRVCTGLSTSIACLKLHISFRKRAINYRALLRKIICKDEACYASWPCCVSCHTPPSGSIGHQTSKCVEIIRHFCRI